MSLYAIDTPVWSRTFERVGRITEANYARGNRRAQYIVTFERGVDFLVGSDDLRRADYCCDGCGRWLPGPPATTDNVVLGDGSIDDTFSFCFLCVKEAD